MGQDLSNWARTQRFTAREVVVVDEAQLPDHASAGDRVTELRRRALKLSAAVQHFASIGRHLRANGSRWSFTEVIECTDVVIETAGLDQLVDVAKPNEPGLLADALDDGAKDDRRAYAFFEAGCVLEDAMNALRDAGLALATAGSSSGQRLGGLIGTGSHGSDFDRPPIADWVRAVLLVAPDGSLVWIEGEGDARLTRDDDAIATLVPGLDAIHRSDRMLDAARVSLGSLGVICALVLEVRESYGLSEKLVHTTWSAVRSGLARPDVGEPALFGDSALLPQHPEAPGGPGTRRGLELLLNPYRIGNDYGPDAPRDRSVLLVSRAQARTFDPERWVRDKQDFALKVEVLVALAVDDRDFNRRVIDALIASGRQDSGGYRHAHDVLSYGRERNEKVTSTEVVITTKGGAHIDFLDGVLARFDLLFQAGGLLAGFLAIRFTRGSRASLAPQSASDAPAELFCHVELAPLQEPETVAPVKGGVIWDPEDPAEQSEDFLEALEEVAMEFRDRGLARLHWGQHGRVTARATASSAIYPRLEEWREACEALCGALPYAFANAYTVRTGLARAPAGFALVGGGPLCTARSEAGLDVRARAAAAPVIVAANDVLTTTIFASNGDGWVSSSPFSPTDPSGARWRLVRHTADEIVDEDEAMAGRVCAAANADGRHELFVRSEDGRVFHRFLGHKDPAEGWYGWGRFDGTPRFRTDPAVALASGGFLHCIAIDELGRIQHRRQYSSLVSIGWKLWEWIPSPAERTSVGAPALVKDGEGRLALFVRTEDGGVWMARQLAASSEAGFAPFAPTPLEDAAGDPVAIVTPEGMLVCAPKRGGGLVAAAGAPDALATIATPDLDAIVLSHSSLTACALGPGRVAVALTDATGHVHVVALRLDGQPDPRSVRLAAGAISGSALARDGDGLVVIVKVAHDLVVWTRTNALG